MAQLLSQKKFFGENTHREYALGGFSPAALFN